MSTTIIIVLILAVVISIIFIVDEMIFDSTCMDMIHGIIYDIESIYNSTKRNYPTTYKICVLWAIIIMVIVILCVGIWFIVATYQHSAP